ncbi:type II toxin-antitoxin system YafO family toxin, partial [Escherichia coli]|uniref:type II toxin-antitoxin system YafO family toxin n=1 Tax=Escherichia coli TaxID=562 RepID=UPI000FF11F45
SKTPSYTKSVSWQHHPNDEAHLVYCQGAFDEQAWLLIAILKPEPHKLARDNNQMHKIGKMAEAFRMRF